MCRRHSTAESIGMYPPKKGHFPRYLACLFCVVMFLLGVTPGADGAPVFGELFTLRQPDGTHIEVRIWGDEFYGVTESLDGYTLVRDGQTKMFCYAQLSADGNELVSSGVVVGAPVRAGLNLNPHLRINPASASAKAAAARARFAKGSASLLATVGRGLRLAPPNNGLVKGITLIVDFSDDAGTIPRSQVDNYCNQVGYSDDYNNGSVHDYFYDVSDGNLTYTNFVPAAYYRALQPKTYYEDPAIDYGTRARELIIEALTDLESSGFDFSQYDSNGDGLVDGVNCFYAGNVNNNWAEGLWPHSWTVGFSADGVSTFKYQITNMGASLLLGTFCHENGHMICYWPDLYDYGYESAGAGRYCLMAYGGGGTNPAEPCAYLKYVAGWSTTTILTAPQTGLTMPSDVNTAYKFEHPINSNEYYMIENRQQAGRDASLPDAGLAIWHIDTKGSNSNEQMTQALHFEATVVQADGNWDLENGVNSGDATDLWAAPTYTQCTPSTTPNTGWWDGSVSGLVVSNISTSASTMTFDFNIDCNNNGAPDQSEIPVACGGSCTVSCDPDCNCDGVPDACQLAVNDCNQNSIPDECDIAQGPSRDCNGNGIPDWCDVTGAGILLDETFEGGLPGGWTVTGTFQITNQCSMVDPDCGGNGWAYAGDTTTCTYGDYEFRELIAPPVTLGYGLSELRFCSRIDTEADWDFGRVRVDGTSVWEDSGGTGVWEEKVVDLTAFAGQTVTITFEFSTDSNTSGWLGWQVDNVYLVSGTPDVDGDGIPDECRLAIPTVSKWGLLAMGVLVVGIGARLVSRRQRQTAVSRARRV